MPLSIAVRSSSATKFKISRLGRKLQISDDPRTLQALPKDVSERIWAELLQKEENELICLDLREEILEEALRIGYEHYMERQTAPFQVHCTAIALQRIIDWAFYRHDPGEDPNAYPPCYIPKRAESWAADAPPEPSVQDGWNLRELSVLEPIIEEVLPSTRYVTRSIEYPVIKPIPKECWFPGRINLTTDYYTKDGVKKRHIIDEDPDRLRPNVELVGENTKWAFVERVSIISDSSVSRIESESEELQKVTDYPGEEASLSQDSKQSSLKRTTPVMEASLQGAGDSATAVPPCDSKRRSRQYDRRSRFGISRSYFMKSRLPPLMADSLSKVSLISDCRLRNLRMDTQIEVSTEKTDTPTMQPMRKKVQ